MAARSAAIYLLGLYPSKTGDSYTFVSQSARTVFEVCRFFEDVRLTFYSQICKVALCKKNFRGCICAKLWYDKYPRDKSSNLLAMSARRDGRVVEGAALEMLFRGNFNEGSNPSLSVKTPKNIKRLAKPVF